ncbi:galactokinase [Halioglobus maricola]|uniref:Galactokinase n=1 Tax=Halioglobus maricola TaxID=2601894 RepID=A0A5P9NI31_9GAMM|nr:galactokinase [Halioglobus maricola]QFU75452.1 galactokinase [Halioglobus maricola]
MSELLPAIELGFREHFGSKAVHITRAPGRVNLIGEHTDYNDGFVLPCAVEYHTLVAISPRDDREVHTLALDWDGQTDSFSLDSSIAFHETQMWSNYVRGVCVEMLARGHQLSGCNIAITGNVPQGAGLSSSAALEVALASAMAAQFGVEIAPVDLALIGQAAENNFVGCACGIMDQLISATGREHFAVAIDCRDLSLTPQAIPSSLALMIVNSNVQRGLVDSEYNTRRQQCEAAAAHFGLSSLRDLTLAEFNKREQELDPVVAKRTRHVLEENQRVHDTQIALASNDIAAVSALMKASHNSMRDLFEITTPQIDSLVGILAGVAGEHGGVRMTGGGFGGCVVALLAKERVATAIEAVESQYHVQTGLDPTIYLTRPSAGVSLVR